MAIKNERPSVGPLRVVPHDSPPYRVRVVSLLLIPSPAKMAMGCSPHMNRIDYRQILTPKTGAQAGHRALRGPPPSSFAVCKLRASRCGMGTKMAHRKGKSYGLPMEFVWSTYGIPMEQHASNTLATRLPRAVGGLTAIDLSDGDGRDTLHCRTRA